MKAKYFLFALALAGLTVACGKKEEKKEGEEKKEEVKAELPKALDAANTYVEFTATKKGAPGHSGKIMLKEGNLEGAEGKVTGGKLTFDLTSLTITDEQPLPKDKEEGLIKHLMSKDFFNTEKFPTATFEITSVEEGKAMGKLTIGETTKEVELAISKMELAGAKTVIEGTGKVMREDFGIKFQPAQGALIENEVSLKFVLTGKE